MENNPQSPHGEKIGWDAVVNRIDSMNDEELKNFRPKPNPPERPTIAPSKQAEKDTMAAIRAKLNKMEAQPRRDADTALAKSWNKGLKEENQTQIGRWDRFRNYFNRSRTDNAQQSANFNNRSDKDDDLAFIRSFRGNNEYSGIVANKKENPYENVLKPEGGETQTEDKTAETQALVDKTLGAMNESPSNDFVVQNETSKVFYYKKDNEFRKATMEKVPGTDQWKFNGEEVVSEEDVKKAVTDSKSS